MNSRWMIASSDFVVMFEVDREQDRELRNFMREKVARSLPRNANGQRAYVRHSLMKQTPSLAGRM